MRNAPDLCRPAPLLPATARHSSLREKAYHWARKGFESREESCLTSQVPLLGGLFLIHHISDSLHVTAHPARWAVATGSSPKRQRHHRNQHVVQRSLGGTAVTAGPARISLLAEDIQVRWHLCRKTAWCLFYFWAKREHHPTCQLWILPPGLEPKRAFASSSLHWRITLGLTWLMENLILQVNVKCLYRHLRAPGILHFCYLDTEFEGIWPSPHCFSPNTHLYTCSRLSDHICSIKLSLSVQNRTWITIRL